MPGEKLKNRSKTPLRRRKKITTVTNSVRSGIIQENDFCVVQTSETSYGMASVSEGKTWITWE